MSARNELPLGDRVVVIAMFVWLSVAVGPWYIGLAVFVGAWLLNMIEDIRGTR